MLDVPPCSRYDGSEPVCEMNSSGNLTAVNDFGADGVWARHTTTTDWFYTFDPQGCLSQKVGRDGSVLCSSIYDAQGHEATTDTNPDPFSGYGGQWGYYGDWETSGDNGGSCLYLLGHRYYDPNAGRFITRDPIGYDGGINLYGYTGNNPVNRADPNGTIGGVLLLGAVVAPEVFLVLAIGTVAIVGVVLLINKYPPANDPPWMNDPDSLRGRDPGGIVTEIPTEWGPGTPSSRGGGTVWRAPGRGGDGIRIMPGNPDVSIPEQRGPYCRVNKGGNLSDHIPLKGNPVLEGEEGGEGEQ